MALIAGLELIDVLLKTSNHINQLFQLSRRYPGQDLPSRFTDNSFHLSDDRRCFFSELNAFGTAIAGAGLPGNQPLLLQLIERTHQ
ncbi:hypothetical protein D3C78_154600 [compost metagenome]